MTTLKNGEVRGRPIVPGTKEGKATEAHGVIPVFTPESGKKKIATLSVLREQVAEQEKSAVEVAKAPQAARPLLKNRGGGGVRSNMAYVGMIFTPDMIIENVLLEQAQEDAIRTTGKGLLLRTDGKNIDVGPKPVEEVILLPSAIRFNTKIEEAQNQREKDTTLAVTEDKRQRTFKQDLAALIAKHQPEPTPVRNRDRASRPTERITVKHEPRAIPHRGNRARRSVL